MMQKIVMLFALTMSGTKFSGMFVYLSPQSLTNSRFCIAVLRSCSSPFWPSTRKKTTVKRINWMPRPQALHPFVKTSPHYALLHFPAQKITMTTMEATIPTLKAMHDMITTAPSLRASFSFSNSAAATTEFLGCLSSHFKAQLMVGRAQKLYLLALLDESLTYCE